MTTLLWMSGANASGIRLPLRRRIGLQPLGSIGRPR
jgi:hypothetical protein